MKITVITVAFNSAATLGDALRSVAAQTHRDVEHIVVDGASTDDTLEVIRQNGHRVTKVLSEPDQGIYDAMNKGLRMARGDMVGFLNADDVYEDTSVLAEIAAAASEPRVDAVYGDLLYVRRDHPDQVVRYWRSGRWSRRRLAFGWMPPHPTFFVRRTFMERHGCFDNRLRIAADYDLMLRYLTQSGICVAYVGRVLVRMRGGGASNRSLRELIRKSREDLVALKRNAVGGWLTLLCKKPAQDPAVFSDGTPTIGESTKWSGSQHMSN